MPVCDIMLKDKHMAGILYISEQSIFKGVIIDCSTSLNKSGAMWNAFIQNYFKVGWMLNNPFNMQ